MKLTHSILGTLILASTVLFTTSLAQEPGGDVESLRSDLEHVDTEYFTGRACVAGVCRNTASTMCVQFTYADGSKQCHAY